MVRFLSPSVLLSFTFFIVSQVRADLIQNLAKAVIYAEKGDVKKAYESIYRYELTNSAIVSIIISKVKKDTSLLQNTFEFVPDLRNEFNDRIKYELSRILFSKGDYAEVKGKIEEISQKTDSVKFLTANIAFLDGDYRKANQQISIIAQSKYTDDNKVRYKMLERAIDEESSPILFSGDFHSSVFFTPYHPPVEYENFQTYKSWDILSNFYGKLYGEFFRYLLIYPFLGYEFAGEFYTDIGNFTLHKIVIGLESSRNFVAGIKYSPVISVFQNDIFSITHRFSSYLFPIHILFLGLNFGLESKNKIDEKSGIIPSVEVGVKLEKKAGNITLGNLSLLEFGKRFAKTQRFSELYASPYLRNYLRAGDFRLDLNLYFSLKMFPAKFEERGMDFLWFAELSPAFDKEFVRLEFAKFIMEGNLSDSDAFSWSRLRAGASVSILF